jgi:hypothetical protein
MKSGETHLNFIDKTPFLCINEGIGIYRLIDFFRVILMVKLLSKKINYSVEYSGSEL